MENRRKLFMRRFYRKAFVFQRANSIVTFIYITIAFYPKLELNEGREHGLLVTYVTSRSSWLHKKKKYRSFHWNLWNIHTPNS